MLSPQPGHSPTAQTTYGKAFKFGRNMWYWNTFGVIQAIFEFLSQTQNIAKNRFLAKVIKNIVFSRVHATL